MPCAVPFGAGYMSSYVASSTISSTSNKNVLVSQNPFLWLFAFMFLMFWICELPMILALVFLYWTGYEKEHFKRMNEKQATTKEAYLWSVSDM